MKTPLRGIAVMLTVILLLCVTVPCAAASQTYAHTPANVVRAETVEGIDLIVTDIQWNNDSKNDAQVKPNTALTFSVTVKNQGSETSGAGFSVSLTAEAQQFATLNVEKAVAAGESVTVKATEPWIAVQGDWRITAMADAASVIAESNEDNNDLAVHIRSAKDVLTAPQGALKRGFSKLVFSDDFNSLDTIDVDATGAEGYHWYVTRPWGEPTQRLDTDYSLADGVLTIKTANKSAWAWSLCTVDAKKTAGFAFQRGYLEYRIRMPYTSDDENYGPSSGVRNPGVWAHSTNSVWASVTGIRNMRGVELDWLEYKGTKYKGGAQFHICLHDTKNGPNVGDPQEFHYTEGQTFYHDDGYAVGGDGEFHVFGCAWSEGMLEFYLDGKLILVKTFGEDEYPDPMANGGPPMLGTFSPLDQQYMPIVLGAVDEFRMEVDYVRIWQSDGSVQPETQYGRWATQFVGKYMTNRDGSNITRVNAKNYQVVLAAEEYWDALLEEEQAEADAILGTSYEKLLEKAKAIEANGGVAPLTEQVWLWIVVGVVAIAAVGMTAVFLIAKKRKSSKQSDVDETQVDP